MREVADAVGVSISSVSNAFNRPDQLSDKLRERILAEAARRGLRRPDPAARSLRHGRPLALGVIYTDRLSFAFSDPAAVLFLQGVSEECEQAGLELVLIPDTVAADVAQTAVGRSMVDGLIVYSVSDDDPVLREARGRVPMVVVDQPTTIPDAPWVGIDEAAAAHDVARHLVDLGHRRFAVITSEIDRSRCGGPVDRDRQARTTYASTAARLNGYRQAITAAGLDWDDVVVVEAVENSEEHGRRATKTVLDRHHVTAVLGMTDLLAIGAIAAIQDRGRDVPGDVAVAGFDDIPTAARHQPTLTTVGQPHREKGRAAAAGLLALIGGDGDAPEPKILPHTLHRRGSTHR